MCVAFLRATLHNECVAQDGLFQTSASARASKAGTPAGEDDAEASDEEVEESDEDADE
jgi:hypothetical protein